MKLVKRMYRSSRTSKPIIVELSPNYSGQGGYDFLSFWSPKNSCWYQIFPETEKDIKDLMSQIQIVYRNFNDHS